MKAFLVVIFDYYISNGKSSLLWNFLFCAFLAITTCYLFNITNDIDSAQVLINNSVSILGILVGFSISMFTLLNTASNANIEAIKKMETGKTLYGKPIYLFDLLLVNMIYVIIGESVVLIFNLLFPFFFPLNTQRGIIAFGIDIFLITHIILTNISAVINFYFILTKK